jgi:tetratricopeptide (TPR) repeat protein
MRFAIVLAVWLAICGESRAQSVNAADEAFAKGRALMAAKRYPEACAAFELSQQLDPQYGTQYNLAGCYAALGKVATAWKLYRELARSDTNATRRARSEELARQIAKQVPKLRIRVDPQSAGLKVRVGTIDVTTLLGAELPFDFGRYAIEARLSGYQPVRREVDVQEPGQTREIEIVLEREPVAEAVAGAPAAPAAPGRVAVAPSRRARHGTIALAGGGAVLGFGLFAGWRALVNRDAARELCNDDACADRDVAQARTDRARLWGNLSTVTVIAGAIGIAGGVYLRWTSRTHAVQVGTTVGPAATTLVLRGAF